MQAQNNAALVEELNTLLERLRIPPEVCIDLFLKLCFVYGTVYGTVCLVKTSYQSIRFIFCVQYVCLYTKGCPGVITFIVMWMLPLAPPFGGYGHLSLCWRSLNIPDTHLPCTDVVAVCCGFARWNFWGGPYASKYRSLWLAGVRTTQSWCPFFGCQLCKHASSKLLFFRADS